MKKTFQAVDRQAWRTWLLENHAQLDEVWLVYFKKQTDKPSISYMESVEEAICFGWIDGIKKRIDDERYTHRFTPRRPGSKWSPRNIEMARRMIAEGRMTPAGRHAFDRRETYDEAFLRTREAATSSLPPWLEEALKADARAWTNFNNLAPSYKKQYVAWISSAKRQETRERRLAEALMLLAENKKLGMK